MPALLDERPVVVIGAGPVGQTTALLLAHHGVRTVVVDARAARDLVGSRTLCQQRDVLDVWETVGAGHRLAGEGVTWTTARTFHRDDQLFAVPFQDRGRSPFPPFVNISQSRTEQVLDECIARTPMIDLRWGSEVVGLDQDEGGVSVRCTTAAGETVLAAPYVVACAGARGDALRRMLGLSFEGSTPGDRLLSCDVRTDLPGWERERRSYFDPVWDPGRQVLVHPCPGSTFRIDWHVPPDVDIDAEEASGRLDARVRQVIGERPYELVWTSVHRFQFRVVDRMQVGRVLVAGDAAHLVAPFGARGMSSGVRDAENAAWKLAFVLHGWAPPSLLASYHDERHAAAVEDLDVMAVAMRFLVPQDDAERAHRQSVLERSRTDDDARALLDFGRLAEPSWYVDSPLTTPDPSRPSAGRPANGHVPPPAPGMLVPDCPVTCADLPDVVRLRQLLRRGVTLLLGDDVAPGGFERILSSTPAEVDVRRMSDLTPELAETLGARPGEVWLVRPDAHVAAVVPDGSVQATERALRRLLTLPAPAGHDDDRRAREQAEAMYAADEASRALGIRLLAVAPGRATMDMRVTAQMVNGHGICHGGYLFLLADSAFAFACNTYGPAVVAAGADVAFLAPVREGDRLVAEAVERVRSGRSGLYDVTVRRDGEPVLEFRGRSRSLPPPPPPPTGDAGR